jgi:steroid 5-alpha reductase family enzyme
MAWLPEIYLYALYSIGIFAVCGWLLSLATNHYSHVDCMWSLFFLMTAITSATLIDEMSLRTVVILVLVGVWALRLSIYIGWRNWGKEDLRYAVIRQNNEPHFWIKSFYIVFAFQAVLAWVISYPLFVSIQSAVPFHFLDIIALNLVLLGLYWEIVADWQLAKFKAHPANKGKVMNQGLWRYSRHPNYFGECLIWWGFYLFALASDAWWAIFSPILMTILLLKISGVALLESTIVERRPDYADYIAKTNAFIPGLPKV